MRTGNLWKFPTSSPRRLTTNDAGEKEKSEELNVSRFSKIEGGRAKPRSIKNEGRNYRIRHDGTTDNTSIRPIWPRSRDHRRRSTTLKTGIHEIANGPYGIHASV